MLWLAFLLLIVAGVLSLAVGVAAYLTRPRPTPTPGTAGVHRAEAGRHRPCTAQPAGESVAGLRAREHADRLRMYPDPTSQP